MSLVLSRKQLQAIRIDGPSVVRVEKIHGNRVQLRIVAGDDVHLVERFTMTWLACYGIGCVLTTVLWCLFMHGANGGRGTKRNRNILRGK